MSRGWQGFGLGALGLLLTASCAGKTDVGQDAGTGGVGGDAGTGGSSTGGSSTGGSSTGGSSAGGSSTGGSGGVMPARCRKPSDSGPCEAYIPRYYHDARTGVCVPFVYGGCEGNDNRFDNLAACQAACHGGSTDMDRCTSPTDCRLLPAHCCGECSTPTASSFVAVNARFANDYTTQNGCDRVDCAACPESEESLRLRANFVATCEASQCRVTDIRETPATACNVDKDCRLRVGADCCEGCGGNGIVAINRTSNLDMLVCGSAPQPCSACAPVLPADLTPVCTNKRCQVRQLP